MMMMKKSENCILSGKIINDDRFYDQEFCWQMMNEIHRCFSHSLLCFTVVNMNDDKVTKSHTKLYVTYRDFLGHSTQKKVKNDLL